MDFLISCDPSSNKTEFLTVTALPLAFTTSYLNVLLYEVKIEKHQDVGIFGLSMSVGISDLNRRPVH